jgi:hypothetical protein
MDIRIKRWLAVMSMSVMVLSVSAAYTAEESKEQAPSLNFQKAFNQSQQQALELLQEKDPQAYQQQKAAMDRQSKIQEITGLYFEGKFPLTEAKSALLPLVKEQMQEDGVFGNLEARIKRLEEQLSLLKKSKEQPELLAEERVNQLLGRHSSGSPAAEGLGFN